MLVYRLGREFDAVDKVVMQGSHIAVGRGSNERGGVARPAKIKMSRTARKVAEQKLVGGGV